MTDSWNSWQFHVVCFFFCLSCFFTIIVDTIMSPSFCFQHNCCHSVAIDKKWQTVDGNTQIGQVGVKKSARWRKYNTMKQLRQIFFPPCVCVSLVCSPWWEHYYWCPAGRLLSASYLWLLCVYKRKSAGRYAHQEQYTLNFMRGAGKRASCFPHLLWSTILFMQHGHKLADGEAFGAEMDSLNNYFGEVRGLGIVRPCFLLTFVVAWGFKFCF